MPSASRSDAMLVAGAFKGNNIRDAVACDGALRMYQLVTTPIAPSVDGCHFLSSKARVLAVSIN